MLSFTIECQLINAEGVTGKVPPHLTTTAMSGSSGGHHGVLRLVGGSLRPGQFPIFHQRSSQKILLGYIGGIGRLLHL